MKNALREEIVSEQRAPNSGMQDQNPLAQRPSCALCCRHPDPSPEVQCCRNVTLDRGIMREEERIESGRFAGTRQ
jgi:hypothetical protein